MYVLILALASANGPVMPPLHDFSTQIKCEQAGIKARELFTSSGIGRTVSYTCTPK